MEKDIYLCLFYLFLSGVSSQSVTLTEDTVYVINNVVGQVTCTLSGNCNGIYWYFSSIKAPVASAFIETNATNEYKCSNVTNGFYQTCDYQSNQYNLYFIGRTDLHGQTIRCCGEGCSPQETVSDTVLISIIVPVSSVSLEGITDQEITVTSGQSKSITCVAGSNRPAPHILWYIGGTNVTSLSTETQIPTQELVYTRSTLTFTPTKSQNGLQVNCKAYNTDNSIVELTAKPTLNVQYGPDSVNLTPPTNSYAVNETFQLGPIRCSATCKPDCDYKWIRPNQNDIQGDTLKINSIQRTQAGTYKCQAYNTVGTRNSNNISVTVHFAAKLNSMEISDGKNFLIPEHSAKTITCLAEGLPKPIITLTYISNSSIIKSVNGLKLDFTFPSARCEDTGIYKCDAFNNFTRQQPLQKDVFILCQPRAAKEQLQNRYALSVGKTLNITVSYIAYPRPTFHWFKNDSNGSWIQITDGQEDVQIKSSVINKYTYLTQFIRKKLKEDDFGNYILVSNNSVHGPKKDVYIVGAKGKPQKPRDGQAMCIDYKSAVITWKPGFFNGDNQTFSVVYKEKGGTEQISVSNISDPGQDKYINHTVNSLQGAKIYFFTIYSRNTLGESPAVEVNCSTKDAPDSGHYNGVAVGAGLGSAIVIIIIVVIVICVVRRFKGGLIKGKRDVEMIGRSADDQEGTFYENMDDINAQKKNDEIKKPKAPKNKTKPRKNKDGLIYADILHEGKPNGESRPVIHGFENKTDYVEVDFSKSGKPLPPDNSQTDKKEPTNK